MEQNNNTLKIGTLLQGSSYQYRIEKVLGQGSFGITYRASVKMTGALGTIDANVKVAIKEFFMSDINGRHGSSVEGLTEGSLPYKYAQRFRKEADNLSKLNHPNIIKVVDFIEANNTFYYVMEYIDGEDLIHYMNNNPLPETEAVSIIKEVGNALTYMHEEKNMLHLDLKPGNIMRRKSDGHIFLIDFGLTKIYADDGKPETSTTIGQGTLGYAPLEQTNPSSKKNSFGPTIDVYSLGATLLKLLTAEPLPTASDVLNGDDLLEDIMSKHHISEHLQGAILHAMEPKPKKRTSSVRQFINDIKISKTENNQDEDATVYDDGRVKDVEVQSFVAALDNIQTKLEQKKTYIDVRSNPKGAAVFLDDMLYGITPAKYQVVPGKHEIKVTNGEAWSSYHRVIYVENAKTVKINAVLTKKEIKSISSNETTLAKKSDGALRLSQNEKSDFERDRTPYSKKTRLPYWLKVSLKVLIESMKFLFCVSELLLLIYATFFWNFRIINGFITYITIMGIVALTAHLLYSKWPYNLFKNTSKDDGTEK